MNAIRLPFPSADLSPNARAWTWHRKAKAAKKARSDAFYVTRAERIVAPDGDGPIDVAITFHPPGRYGYDRDNLQARMKPALDGIAQALGVDDVRFRPRVEIGDVVKGGSVTVEVRAL